jgi:hypothetical protein
VQVTAVRAADGRVQKCCESLERLLGADCIDNLNVRYDRVNEEHESRRHHADAREVHCHGVIRVKQLVSGVPMYQNIPYKGHAVSQVLLLFFWVLGVTERADVEFVLSEKLIGGGAFRGF